MELNIYQIDAFAERVFEGNPAAVCPLDTWLPDALLQNIAQENNLSETAFFVPDADGFHLRWFTPSGEVDLCGHATLATAHVLFTHLAYGEREIRFQSKSGLLTVEKVDAGYRMFFPTSMPVATDTPAVLLDALGVQPKTILASFDYVVVLDNEAQVRALSPEFLLLKQLDLRGVVVTAPGDAEDFVSRCFYPKYGINEDPVTGSAHCILAPYWAEQLGKTTLVGKQLSLRTGLVGCEVRADQVVLTGRAVDYLQGRIFI